MIYPHRGLADKSVIPRVFLSTVSKNECDVSLFFLSLRTSPHCQLDSGKLESRIFMRHLYESMQFHFQEKNT